MSVTKLVTDPVEAAQKCPRCPNKARKDDRWDVQVYNPTGPNFRRIIHGKGKAEEKEAEIKVRFASGGGLAPANLRNVTVEDYAERFLAGKSVGENTMTNYRWRIAFITERFKGVRLATLQTTPVWSDAFNAIEASSGRSTRRVVEVLTREMLRRAVAERVLPAFPLTDVKVGSKRPSKGKQYRPGYPELVRLRDQARAACGRHVGEQDDCEGCGRPKVMHGRGIPAGDEQMMTALLDTLMGTGVRIGEALAFDPADVDREAGTWRLRRQLLWLTGSKRFVYAPCKHDSERDIPLPGFTLSSLAATQLRNGLRPTTLPWETPNGKPETHRLFFHQLAGLRLGQPLIRGTLGYRLASFGRAAGLPERVHPHTFRHSYSTLLLNAGVPEVCVDAVTGHQPSGSVTGRYYTEPTPEGMALIVPTLERAFADGQAKLQRRGLRAVGE